MRIRKKLVNGHHYYYIEETLRLEKPKIYSIFLGKSVPSSALLNIKKNELTKKICFDLLGEKKSIYLSSDQLIQIEKQKRRYLKKIFGLSKAKLDEKDEIDTVNFVYTTLATEGVPISKADANLAYRFSGKHIRSVRDDNLQVALDMIKGLRYLRESKKGISESFLLALHNLIMAEYTNQNPGLFRKKQAYIFLKSYEKAEEIRFRPPAPDLIKKKISELITWYNSNVDTLNAIELGALLHLRFYLIHPFHDGNKRISRLLLNKAFFDTGYPLLNISKDTENYFDALINSVEKKDELPFVYFVFQQFLRYIK